MLMVVMIMISLLSGILSLILCNTIHMIVVTNAYVPTISTVSTKTSKATQPYSSIINFNKKHTTTTNNNNYNNHNNIGVYTKTPTTIRRMAVDEQIFTTPSSSLQQSTDQSISSITELPDSLSDAAIRAAEATKSFYDLNNNNSNGNIPIRCRIDFDTTIGDETFTLFKQSTEFMQQYITAISYAFIPQLLQQRQEQLINIIQAQNELQLLQQQSHGKNDNIVNKEQREDELIDLIANNGRNISDTTTTSTTTTNDSIKPVIRIYFPDEGSAALARRDWINTNSIIPIVADSIEFKSCNGIQPLQSNNTKVIVQIFFCPRASDADAVERILLQTETDSIQQSQSQSESSESQSLLTIFVNPILVDMGVTGFGYAGRRLRERLIEPLQYIYYLRTLSWGAITRQYPLSFTIWQEDNNEIGGYKCIANCYNRLPSNPEVIDIYEMVNNNNNKNDNNNSGGGFLDQLGDFVNGMMKL